MLTLRFAHSTPYCRRVRLFVIRHAPNASGLGGSSVGGTRYPTDAGIICSAGLPLLLRFRLVTAINTSRRNGPPGVLLGYFQRTIVRYTRLNHMMDRGLCPVLRTRPGLPPPHLPALHLLRCGAYLYVNPRFCLRLPPALPLDRHLAFGYPSPPSGWVWTLPDTLCFDTGHHHLAAGPCPAHIGIGPPLTGRPSHTTQHTGPNCAVRLIWQVHTQGNTRPSDLKWSSGNAM